MSNSFRCLYKELSQLDQAYCFYEGELCINGILVQKKRDPLLPLVPQGWQITLTCHLYTKWIISGICKNLRRRGSRKNSPLSFDSSWIKLLLFVPCRVEGEKFSLAPKILANFLERKTQFYEQGATVRRIGQYVRNWWRWVRAGVEKREVSIDCLRFAC
jgi:hypothetical protein